jgi:hypothetical protein
MIDEDGIQYRWEFFSFGREAIVRLFDSMIAEQMHTEWGRSVSSERQ